MLLLALLAGVTAIFYQYHTTRRAVAYWGPQQAMWIRDAEQVDFCWLEALPTDAVGSADPAGERPLAIEGDFDRTHDAEVDVPSERAPGADSSQDVLQGAAGESWRVIDRQPIASVAGLSHLRHALLQDESYDWTRPADRPPEEPTCALLFEAEGGRVVVLLDHQREWLRDARQSRWQSVVPISPFLQRFLARLGNWNAEGSGQSDTREEF